MFFVQCQGVLESHLLFPTSWGLIRDSNSICKEVQNHVIEETCPMAPLQWPYSLGIWYPLDWQWSWTEKSATKRPMHKGDRQLCSQVKEKKKKKVKYCPCRHSERYLRENVTHNRAGCGRGAPSTVLSRAWAQRPLYSSGQGMGTEPPPQFYSCPVTSWGVLAARPLDPVMGLEQSA